MIILICAPRAQSSFYLNIVSTLYDKVQSIKSTIRQMKKITDRKTTSYHQLT